MMSETSTVLRSEKDRSINLVVPSDDLGAIESRYVRRTTDTVIIYLSSSTGCDLACRFCHLTQTKQTMDTPVTIDGFIDQAETLLELADKEDKLKGARIIHFNFMARGDVLNNPHFVNHTRDLIQKLTAVAATYNLSPKFKISTIFPINDLFGKNHCNLKDWVHATLGLNEDIEFYYSLYSLNPSFRKRWVPKAIDPNFIGQIFSGTVNKVRLHHALIDGDNTSYDDICSIGRWLTVHDIHTRFNLVRYNPYGKSSGREPSECDISWYLETIASLRHISSAQVISRVGEDVFASCGMFVNLL